MFFQAHVATAAYTAPHTDQIRMFAAVLALPLYTANLVCAHRSRELWDLSQCRRDPRNGPSHGNRFHQQHVPPDGEAAHSRCGEASSALCLLWSVVLLRTRRGGGIVVRNVTRCT